MRETDHSLDELEKRIQYRFGDRTLLMQALTHKSYCGDSGKESVEHNEKLEFLGDAVIDLAIAALLMQYHPKAPEGVLTRKRAALVNQTQLATKALELELDKCLRIGKSEEHSEGRSKPSLLSDAFEALCGALYLDAGLPIVLERVETFFFEELCQGSDEDEASPEALGDFKSALQEFTQMAYRTLPVYSQVEQRGPEHQQVFAWKVQVGDVVQATGEGPSKKRAQQEAARGALQQLRQQFGPEEES